MTEFNSEAINIRAASELLAPVREQDLKTLHFMTEHQSKPAPTVSGFLLTAVWNPVTGCWELTAD
jgi:hypothetical protein